ncbi:hypothetical protein HYH02_005014 [Chlamydomonas schloesseri]|uniref:Bifunctional inhibitor/plant lipid transfer protein/seed storage helical domain-containing protein n=1 Tax=Chlamydomonas schloesseri TaxID=2026947 RepID=A0A835WNK5_9CHLO|nr:hypothetical protein HYH02_005014 [Chlamydomonas schloesseri]|eukprot:KAG2450513.1 hypothetical protein HYH02_005014 [Chlamydomonas schloesseri]
MARRKATAPVSSYEAWAATGGGGRLLAATVLVLALLLTDLAGAQPAAGTPAAGGSTSRSSSGTGPLVPPPLPPGASPSPKCEQARLRLPNEPSVAAFKACAVVKPITAECCLKLLPYAQYVDCLAEPAYRAVAQAFLDGAATVEEVQGTCLS